MIVETALQTTHQVVRMGQSLELVLPWGPLVGGTPPPTCPPAAAWSPSWRGLKGQHQGQVLGREGAASSKSDTHTSRESQARLLWHRGLLPTPQSELWEDTVLSVLEEELCHLRAFLVAQW